MATVTPLRPCRADPRVQSPAVPRPVVTSLRGRQLLVELYRAVRVGTVDSAWPAFRAYRHRIRKEDPSSRKPRTLSFRFEFLNATNAINWRLGSFAVDNYTIGGGVSGTTPVPTFTSSQFAPVDWS